MSANMPGHPRYSLGDTIAKGDYATVFRGRDLELDREIAVKQIHAQYLDDPRQLERYWQEAQLIANLEHPRIMTIYDIVRDRGWLILELMLGSIQELLHGRLIDLEDLRTLLTSIAGGLKFLEENGIVHGDVKPSNILLDKNRRFKLGDFGIARRLAGDSGSVVKGTTKYMAPEVVSDQAGVVGPHSDLYSLGFSAYELMCGKNFEQLFPGLNMFGRDRQIAWIMWHSAPDRRLPPISKVLNGVPGDLAHVIEKLCEKDPAKRYRKAEEVLDDLKKDSGAERKKAAEELAQLETQRQQAKRKRLLAISAAAASLVLSIALAFLPTGPAKTDGGDVKVVKKEPERGTVLHIDQEGQRFMLKPPEGPEGPVEFRPDTDIILLNEATVLRFEQLQEGDQVVVEQPAGTGIKKVKVTRATTLETSAAGLLVSVDSASNLTFARSGKGPDDRLTVFVPSAVAISLNGQIARAGRPVRLSDLQPQDAVDLKYSAGRDGPIARTVEAWRTLEARGVIETFNEPAELTLRLESDTAAVTTLKVAADCLITINQAEASPDGHKFKLRDLQKGDWVVLQHAREVRRMAVTRQLTVTGSVASLNPTARSLVVRLADQSDKEFVLAAGCEIKLAGGDQTVDFASLREGDTVTLVQNVNDGKARSLELALQPDPRTWAVVLGFETYDDQQLAKLTTGRADLELLRQTFSTAYRVPDEQLWCELGASRLLTEQKLPAFLARVAKDAQLLVYFGGHAYLVDGVAYLAPKEFDQRRPKETGILLTWFLDQLDACPATDKTLLLDATHDGPGRDAQRQPSAAEIAQSLKVARGRISESVHIVASCDRNQRDLPAPDGVHSLFAFCTAEALRGRADRDQDHRVSRTELVPFLQSEMARLGKDSGQEQTPVLVGPGQATRLTKEGKSALRQLLLETARGKLDAQVLLVHSEANVAAPNQPDAAVMLALCKLKDRRSTVKPPDLKSLATMYPKSVVIHHLLAWQLFNKREKRDVKDGLEALKTAIENVTNPNDPYALHLFEFAGQLAGFAKATAAESEPPDLQALNQAIAKHGSQAQDRYRRGGSRSLEIFQNLKLPTQKINLASYASLGFQVIEAYLAAMLDREQP